MRLSNVNRQRDFHYVRWLRRRQQARQGELLTVAAICLVLAVGLAVLVWELNW